MDNTVDDVHQIACVPAEHLHKVTTGARASRSIPGTGKIAIMNVIERMPDAVTVAGLSLIFHRSVNMTEPPMQHLRRYSPDDVVGYGQLDLQVFQHFDLCPRTGERLHFPAKLEW